MLVSLCLSPLTPAGQGVTFTPHYTDAAGTGFLDPALGAQRRSAFEFALQIWQVHIPGTMSCNIDVDASFVAKGGSKYSATLAEAGPSAFDAHFAGAPRQDVAYPSALANYLAGQDLNGSAKDIDIKFNIDIDGPVALGSGSWYYGLDGQAPPRDVDFVSVAVHELTHSLGFISTGFSDGTFGADTSCGVMPTAFDSFLVNGSGQQLISLPERASNFTKPVYWSGGQGVREYQKVFADTSLPRMYSPATFSDGSSLSHLDEQKFTGAYDMMTPVASGVVHSPDDIVRGVMADIGWQSTGAGDVDADGAVGILDVFAMLSHLNSRCGETGYAMAADVNLDGVIDNNDLAALASHFGQQGSLGAAPTSAALQLAGPMTVLPGTMDALVYQSVPEPLTAGLLLAGFVAGAKCRRRRHCGAAGL